jgi:small subunit ribosomal protein S5
VVERYKLARKSRFRNNGQEEDKEKKMENIKEEIKEVVSRPKKTLINETVDDWTPSTALGKRVKAGEIKTLDEIFDNNLEILEPLIIDYFVDDLKEKIVESKKTSYVRRSGRKYNFRCSVLVGDGNKFVGLGTGKDKDKWNSVRKAARKARLNLIRVKKGCGSWQCPCGTEHSLPFLVSGKCSSVKVNLRPAPKGVGLVVADNIKPVFEFVDLKDVWSKTEGSTSTTLNFIKATINALAKTYKNMDKKRKE